MSKYELCEQNKLAVCATSCHLAIGFTEATQPIYISHSDGAVKKQTAITSRDGKAWDSFYTVHKITLEEIRV